MTTPKCAGVQIWQMNLLQPMDAPVPQQRCLEYQYTKLGRWTYFGWWTTHYQSRDALNTSTQNLADEPTMANGPPSTRAQMPCIPVNTTWQMNLLWPMDPLSPVSEQRWLAYHYTKLGRWTYFGWTQWQRFESSSIHLFWDTPQHFLKTHFCLESSFLSFLELQKSLLVSFQGCWTQWQRFESSSIHCFWDT